MARSTLALVLLCGLVAAVAAYPPLWVAEEEAVDDCTAHPTKAEGAHKAPVADKATTFVVSDAKGPVKALCPGGNYTVLVTYEDERRTLLTASAGSLAGANASSSCTNRAYTTKVQDPATTWKDTLSVPCDAEGEIELAVTSAAGKTKAFNNAAAKLAVKALADCPASTCKAAAAAALPGAAKANATATAAKDAVAGAAKDAKDAVAAAVKSGAALAGPLGASLAAAALLALALL